MADLFWHAKAYMRIHFIRISRLKFAKLKNIFRVSLNKEYEFVSLKFFNTKQLYVFN